MRHSQQTGSTLSFLIIGFHFSNLLDKNVSDINGMSHKVFLDAVIASIPKVDSNLKKKVKFRISEVLANVQDDIIDDVAHLANILFFLLQK